MRPPPPSWGPVVWHDFTGIRAGRNGVKTRVFRGQRQGRHDELPHPSLPPGSVWALVWGSQLRIPEAFLAHLSPGGVVGL